ncbi:MAG TPA: DUF4342 domain-containing protein [Bryobacteraceae bacterium]|nr:DUF4342 domain-containing protein [Bryobacteraceae bacterium]
MALNFEEFKVQARDLVDKVGELIRQGNVRRVIIKDDKGRTFIEIPVTVAAIGVLAAPVLAAIGAMAALVANFTLVVEKGEAGDQPAQPAPQPPVPQV